MGNKFNMKTFLNKKNNEEIESFGQFLKQVDYSLIDVLNVDPQSEIFGDNNNPREVFTGHYVPVKTTPIPSPKYVAHSKKFFNELGLSQKLVHSEGFIGLFSGDFSLVHKPMRSFGWATGYALSIYGKEYIQQCPFGTGNGYGDGRAISVYEGVFKGKRWEMQLKGAGPTPYCRGGDGRAVLRSSLREFLAQEFMNELRVPTTRSLTLFVSQIESVRRPWYTKNTRFIDPDIILDSPVAITTRVATSFLRIGQLELFARRVRNNEHENAEKELRMLVNYVIKRNYDENINSSLNFSDKVVELAYLFREKFSSLVVEWMRVGYCQGNFNSDNCSLGGITLDYGPFGFCEMFDPEFQPWTGGGKHFSFFNQPIAAEANFIMFWKSIRLLLKDNPESLEKLDHIKEEFSKLMREKLNKMWSKKLGLKFFDENLVNDLFSLMTLSRVDYTKFFRMLSLFPKDISLLKDSFYSPFSEQVENLWNAWLGRWNNQIKISDNNEDLSKEMNLYNPKYTWREWLIVEAYEKAELGDLSYLNEIQEVLSKPYEEQSDEIEKKYDRLRPVNFFNCGGISHYSCSS